jgi:DNA-binding NarL/FixJ family response regulator
MILVRRRRIRVAVRSGHDIVRTGVEQLLQEFPERVEVVDLRHDPDVVVYDVVGLHEGDGHDLEILVKLHPGRVVALARDLRPALAARALAMGAIATAPIGAGALELVDVVEAAADGRLQDGSAADLENQAERDRLLGRDVNLTEREREVLALIVSGVSNQELADELFLTINTVKSVIRSAYAKIGVSTRSQAVAWGVNHGFHSEGADGDPPREATS